MKTRMVTLCVILALSMSVQAQDQTAVQGSAKANTQTSVSASPLGASATGNATGTASAGATGGAAVTGATEINATLTQSLDASRNKVGDEVTAKAAQDVTAGGQVVIPKGSKLIGRVTHAQARTKGSAGASAQSQLGLVFERAVLKDGREIALSATVQALAASVASLGASGADAGMSSASGVAASGSQASGGVVGGVSGAVSGATHTVGGVSAATQSTVGSSTQVVSKSAGALGGLNAAGQLSAGSRGAFGLTGLDINSMTSGSAQGSLITSTTRNVRLEGGTRMLLVTGASASSGAGTVGSASGAASAAGSGSGAVNKPAPKEGNAPARPESDHR